jgi:hypothetical protein
MWWWLLCIIHFEHPMLSRLCLIITAVTLFSSLERTGIHGPPVIIEGSEYWFVADPHLNYEEAVLYCASNHSFLATITSFTGLKAIKNKLANVI